jgi:hypothetical protein
MKKIFLLISFCGLLLVSKAQDAPLNESPLSFGVDLYSRYVWRGLEFSDAPNIQPWASISWKGLTLMTWGSYATSKDYAEVDLMLSYAMNNLTVGVNDYFNPKINGVYYDYTNWTDSITPHLVEAYVTYQLPFKKLPLLFTASTLIYGSADRNANNGGNYSTYLEVSYPFTTGNYNVNVFAGATVNEGFYASKAAFVNVGAKAARSIAITDKFEVPVNLSLTFNPEAKIVYFIAGFSF